MIPLLLNVSLLNLNACGSDIRSKYKISVLIILLNPPVAMNLPASIEYVREQLMCQQTINVSCSLGMKAPHSLHQNPSSSLCIKTSHPSSVSMSNLLHIPAAQYLGIRRLYPSNMPTSNLLRVQTAQHFSSKMSHPSSVQYQVYCASS